MATDPTQTTVLRAQYNAALQRRFRALQRAARDAVLNRDMLGLATPFGPGAIETRINDFITWIVEQMDAGILEVVNVQGQRIEPFGSEWQREFVDQGYVRGVRRANLNVAQFTTPSGVNLQAPIHVLRLQELFVANFELLEGITAAVAADLRAVLTEAMVEGVGAEEAARRIDRRIDVVGRNRARLLARTEIIRAHAEGTLDEFERQDVAVVVPQVEFMTAGDVRVCTICLTIQSTDRFGLGPGVFPVRQARGIIPVHPQCRCTWLPAGFVGTREDVNARMRRAERARRRIEELRTSPAARRRQREAQERRNRRRRPVELI